MRCVFICFRTTCYIEFFGPIRSTVDWSRIEFGLSHSSICLRISVGELDHFSISITPISMQINRLRKNLSKTVFFVNDCFLVKNTNFSSKVHCFPIHILLSQNSYGNESFQLKNEKVLSNKAIIIHL